MDPYFSHFSILDESEVWSFMQLVGQGPTRHKLSLRGPLCHVAIGVRQSTLKLGGLKQQLYIFIILQVYEPSGWFYRFEWAHLCIVSKLGGWLEAGWPMMALVGHVSLTLQQASLGLLL